MSFPVKYSKKCVQKVKVLSLWLYSFRKMVQQSKVQLAPPTRFKMLVLTPKLDMGILLYAKFLLKKYFKSSHYRRKLSDGSKQVLIACVRLAHQEKIFRSSRQALFSKLTVLFEACSRDMYLLHSYTRLQLSKSFPLQSIFRQLPIQNTCKNLD